MVDTSAGTFLTLTLSDWADVTSLIGFVLTLAVFFSVRELRRGVLYKARVPELIQRLKEHRAELNTFLFDFTKSSAEHQRQLPAIHAAVEAIEDKIGWYFSAKRRNVRRVREIVETQRSRPPSRANAEKLHEELTFLVVALEQDGRDREWRI